MKKKFLLQVFVLIIAGCATPADRRSNPPDIVTFSKKSAKEVAICIADIWENTKPFMQFSSPQVNTSLKLNGYSIIVTNIGGFGNTLTIALADVTENQLESITKYYKMDFAGAGNYDQAVNECQLTQIPQPITNNKGNPSNNF